jgi:N-acetylneuraminate lyase
MEKRKGMENIKFSGIMPALITPFNADNKTINEEATKKLIDLHLSQGADGFYVLGSTGEGVVMGAEERKQMCEIAVNHVNKRKPVICHVASTNLNEATELARHAEKAGADAISAIPPLVFVKDKEGIYNYYKTLAGSVSIPFIVYNYPGVQVNMDVDLIAKLYEIDNITGIKWSINDFYGMMRLKDVTNGEMNIISGPDEMLIQGLAAGADAGIGTTYNIMLPEYLKIYKYFNEGRTAEAREMQLKVNRVTTCLIKYGAIPSVKYALNQYGYNVGECTYPMRRFTKEQGDALMEELKECGWPLSALANN